MKKFNNEFKANAVRLAREEGVKIGDVASDLSTLSFGFILLILRDFYLENGHLTLPCGMKPKNLSKASYENQQNKPKTQVNKVKHGFF